MINIFFLYQLKLETRSMVYLINVIETFNVLGPKARDGIGQNQDLHLGLLCST